MDKHSFKYLSQLFKEFSNIKNYKDKLIFFDNHFGLLPFNFKLIDLELSWFKVLPKTGELIELFQREKNSPTNYYEKRYTFNNNAVIIFDIKPNFPEQLILNKYVLEKLITTKNEIIETLEREIKHTSNPQRLLEKKIAAASEAILWVRETLKTATTNSIKLQFLNLFYTAYAEFYDNDKLLRKRRKFVELYLYSQGLFFINYIQVLKEKLEEAKTSYTPKSSPLLKEKFILLQKLGIIDLLKKKYNGKSKSAQNIHIAEIISFLITNGIDKTSIKNNSQIINKYLSSMSNIKFENEDDFLSKIIAQYL